jgi:cytochrome c
MRTRNAILVSLSCALALGIGGAQGESPNLGKPITPADLAEWDIDIEPSGAGLPPGSGTAAQGAVIFADNCALCHGDGGKGGVFLGKGAPAAPALVEDKKINGIDESTTTIANYWPYATTLFDYIRRVIAHPSRPADQAGAARAARMAVSGLRPLRRPVATMEQRSA